MNTSTERGAQVVGELIKRINGVIAEMDVTYDEYSRAMQWMIEVGEAGEWPLFLDAFIENAVEKQASRTRAGSDGTILGPYHLPGAPVLEPPYELPVRPDEAGERLLMTGRVLSADGSPVAGAILDVWQADAEGFYSGFSDLPEGILRGKVPTDEQGRFELRTIMPAPYMIPHEGPTGHLLEACGWHPWRPAHVHLLVSGDGHETLITQLYFADGEYLDSDVANAVKESLTVHPERDGDSLHIDYEFRLAPVPSAVLGG